MEELAGTTVKQTASTVTVLEPGLQTTVQDGGRVGFLNKGIPPAGAQDNFSLRMASMLVGNAVPQPLLVPGDPGHAGLEILLKGPSLLFNDTRVIAISGADVRATVDGTPIGLWESVLVPAGSRLDIGMARKGVRAYLAIAGGVAVPSYLGSRSTYIRGAMGGLKGRALQRGDALPLGPLVHPPASLIGRKVRPELVPPLGDRTILRAVPGPQEHLFEPEAVSAFFDATWTLSPVSDRMGFRLHGPRLTFRRSTSRTPDPARPQDIVDDVIPLGGIQIPSASEAIVLGVEVPSVGGYAKIGTVVSADLGRLGQVRPGGHVEFARMDADEARELCVALDNTVTETALVAS
jgi:antagonist of KipI